MAYFGIRGLLDRYFFSNRSDNIPDNYIALFRSGTGEQTLSTYLYQTKDQYNYIYTIDTTKSWGSDEWIQKIQKRGKLKKKEDIFTIVQNNKTGGWVSFPNLEGTYTVEEAKEILKDNP